MDPQPPKRTGAGLAILAAIAISGSAVGVMFWQLSQKEKPVADRDGFDISRPKDLRPVEASPAQPAAQGPAQDGLSLLHKDQWGKEGGGGEKASGAPLGTAPKDAATGFTAAVRRNEAKAEALARAYTARYPAIAQYGRDWMGYPDLKKLNDDYMRDHDPIKFLRGLAGSQNFGKLTVKYARDPALQAFVKESVAKAPGEVVSAAVDMLAQDATMRGLLASTAKSLGLPPSFAEGLLRGGKVDEKQVMGKALENNPELQNALENPGAGK